MGYEVKNIEDKLDALDAINEAEASLKSLYLLLIQVEQGGGIEDTVCISDIVRLNEERCRRAVEILSGDPPEA